MHNTITNKYSFKYIGRKITLIPMTAVEILREDLMRVEKRKEPFRKEWVITYVTIPSSKSKFLQNEDIVLPRVGTNIFAACIQNRGQGDKERIGTCLR